MHSRNPSPPSIPLYEAALALLRKGVGNPEAKFRDGQFDAIEHVLNRRGPLLVVQKTGWGKSNVYFIISKMLRDAGSGPVLLISPLLALMRNQMVAATRMGLEARRVTSEEKSREEWDQIKSEVLAGKIDVLLISPERLANDTFITETLTPVAQKLGMLVVDEAHCISDWGHDFRPDYRRITRILQSLPRNIPILATTATANNRVIEDLKVQLGSKLKIMRGEMTRPSLCLQVIHLPAPVERMAWLAETLRNLPGSGIIYTLTIRDARIVAKWLKENGIAARPYWGAMDKACRVPGLRETIEQDLLANRIKALVATTALGMGFDKPDLSFVIHYQLPGSVIHYYQQVGRAGRALDKAHGILLCGSEDKEITDHFIDSAFPVRENIEQLLTLLDGSANGMTQWEIQRHLNLSHGEVSKALKLLTLESPAPIICEHTCWKRTSARLRGGFWERIERLTNLRRASRSKCASIRKRGNA